MMPAIKCRYRTVTWEKPEAEFEPKQDCMAYSDLGGEKNVCNLDYGMDDETDEEKPCDARRL